MSKQLNSTHKLAPYFLRRIVILYLDLPHIFCPIDFPITTLYYHLISDTHVTDLDLILLDFIVLTIFRESKVTKFSLCSFSSSCYFPPLRSKYSSLLLFLK
jgi:hypothetical protein